MPGAPPKPSAAQRAAQSARDKRIAAKQKEDLRVAGMRSIPRGPPRKKAELFTQGALKSFQFAPRGHGYYDAFAQRPDDAVVSATTGPATCVCGNSVDVITGEVSKTGTYTYRMPMGPSDSLAMSGTHTSNGTKLIVFNPSSSDSRVATTYTLNENGGVLNVLAAGFHCAQFTELGPAQSGGTNDADHLDGLPAGTNANPSRRVESIPLRGSIRIRNMTEALSVGGSVKILRYNGGLSFNADNTGTNTDNPAHAPDVDAFLSVCSMIRDAERTHAFTGHELTKTHQINTHPADFVRAMTFSADTHFTEAVRNPRYNTVLILIDDFLSSTGATARNNTYEITMRVHRAARFTMGSILHSLQKPLVSDPATVNRHADFESKMDRPQLLKLTH
jgi:hypothetical protein